jgi:hypothetical protein
MFDSDDFNLASWRWAEMVITTRAFAYQRQGENQLVLLPLLDMVNHGPGNMTWEFDDDRFMMRTHQGWLEGEEITMPYGPFDNAQLLQNYGFTLNGNKQKIAFPHKNNVSVAMHLFGMNSSLQELVEVLSGPNQTTLNQGNVLHLKKEIMEQLLGVEGEDFGIEYNNSFFHSLHATEEERGYDLGNRSLARENKPLPRSQGMAKAPIVEVEATPTPTPNPEGANIVDGNATGNATALDANATTDHVDGNSTGNSSSSLSNASALSAPVSAIATTTATDYAASGIDPSLAAPGADTSSYSASSTSSSTSSSTPSYSLGGLTPEQASLTKSKAAAASKASSASYAAASKATATAYTSAYASKGAAATSYASKAAASYASKAAATKSSYAGSSAYASYLSKH